MIVKEKTLEPGDVSFLRSVRTLSSHSDALALIAGDLQRVDMKMQATGEVFQPLAGAINLLLESGGKRMRPALALLVSRLYPAAEPDRVVSLAAAVEMLHSATLVHCAAAIPRSMPPGARGRRSWPATSSLPAPPTSPPRPTASG